MITDCEDFCTLVFVVVDDIWKLIESFFRRPGSKPECADRELIAMTLIGECLDGIWKRKCRVVSGIT